MIKTCTKCNTEKSIEDYHKKKNGKFGVRAICKHCSNNETKLFKKNNPEYFKKRYLDNLEHIKNKSKEEYIKNKSKIHQNYLENIEQKKIYNKSYWEEHKEEIRVSNRDYCRNNRNKINIYYKDRRKNDLEFLIQERVRSRIKMALKSSSINKTNKTIELVGCTIFELKEWLEKQFTPEMSWEDRASFHIDHILPCAEFDLRNSEEQEICFHYTNLRPITPLENLQKSDKVL